jgi:anthranilate synthase component 1
LNALVDRSDWVYLLESVSGPRKLAEFSFLGWGPVAKITASDGVVEIWDRGSGQVVLQEEANPLQILRDVVLGAKLVETRFRFLGGAVGYISFESLRFWEDISFRGKPSTPFPDMQFGIYERGLRIWDKPQRNSGGAGVRM